MFNKVEIKVEPDRYSVMNKILIGFVGNLAWSTVAGSTMVFATVDFAIVDFATVDFAPLIFDSAEFMLVLFIFWVFNVDETDF